MRKPWWVWRTHPSPQRQMTETVEQYVGKRKRVSEQPVELMLEVPYMWKPAAMRSGWTRREIEQWASVGQEEALLMNEITTVLSRWLARHLAGRTPGRSGAAAYSGTGLGPPTVFSGIVGPASGYGSMAVISARDIYAKSENTRRSQRYDFMLTPPLYKFCDLTGVFSHEDIGPLTFWIQPEVHAETGEIMQGSPVAQSYTGQHWGGRPTRSDVRHAIGHADLQKALDGAVGGTAEQRAAAIVQIALDSYLERGQPDPRFLNPDELAKMVDPF